MPSTAVRRPVRRSDSQTLPLRDWKRAFALVDGLKARFGRHPWFRGVRAFWDARLQSIRIELETAVAFEPGELLGPALVDLGIGVRCVEPPAWVDASAR